MSRVQNFDSQINRDLLLGLKFEEGTGTITHDFAKPHHPDVTLTGPPAWADVSGLPVLDFDSATPDFIEIAAADTADLDFTTEDFSCAVWVYLDSLVTTSQLFMRGLWNTDGWWLTIHLNGLLQFYTAQAGVQVSYSDAGAIATGQWYFISSTRAGASGRVYRNGADITTTAGVHINPLTSNRKLLIGVWDDETQDPFDGQMWYPRIWGRALDIKEQRFIFESERHFFGV